MDDNEKQVSSYQLDQEILDERGINMTVEEVAGLSTCKYAARVQELALAPAELAFLKGLRRRIKNRLASQNSRRRSMEQLRRLTRELRSVRTRRDAASAERRALVLQRDAARRRCTTLRLHVLQVLKERADPTEIPSIEIERMQESTKPTLTNTTKTPHLTDTFTKPSRDKNLFECRIEKLVQQSVNHMFKEDKTHQSTMEDKLEKLCVEKMYVKTEKIEISDCKISDEQQTDRKVYARTVFISEYDKGGEVDEGFDSMEGEGGVLNLSVKEGRRRHHGRKQSAPKRIVYDYTDGNDGVLDLKIKKESQ